VFTTVCLRCFRGFPRLPGKVNTTVTLTSPAQLTPRISEGSSTTVETLFRECISANTNYCDHIIHRFTNNTQNTQKKIASSLKTKTKTKKKSLKKFEKTLKKKSHVPEKAVPSFLSPLSGSPARFHDTPPGSLDRATLEHSLTWVDHQNRRCDFLSEPRESPTSYVDRPSKPVLSNSKAKLGPEYFTVFCTVERLS
jgi:hypothetical protein